MTGARAACMVAYANYFNDARIKNYVDALLKVGYEVDVLALGQSESPRPGLRLISLMSKVASNRALAYVISQSWFFLLALFRLGTLSAVRRYRFVHVHNMPNFIVFSAIFPKILGARVVLDVHDTMPEAYATKFDLDLNHPLVRFLRGEERLSAAFADLVITTNDLHRQALIGHGLPAPKIATIMNLGNPAIFRPCRSSRARPGLVLGYHGTVAERLGIDLIIHALHRARPRCPGLRFLLLGDGEFMPTVRRLVADYALEDSVTLRGWVPVERLPAELAEVDVGVVANRHATEVRHNWMLPVKMLEYAAMEIPTIAPRLRVISHYFDDNSALLYTPDSPADLARAIEQAYTQPERLARIRQGLRDFNARYSWPSMERRYLELVGALGDEVAA
jgi:glycosyltransferase involved in cell wall biosynthesis